MRILVTRPRSEADEFAQALRQMGTEAVFFPTIAISPIEDSTVLDWTITHLQVYDWLVFTSANAARVVFERKSLLGIDQFPENLRIAAIGPKTAAYLAKHGVFAHFTPAEHTSEAIISGLGDLDRRWVFLPLADIAHESLPEAIQEANGIAHVVTTYHTLPAQPDPEGLAAICEGVDMITFTSGSTARNFAAMVARAGLDPLHLPGAPVVACIGPKTAHSARELGYSPAIVAHEYTSEGLVAAISAYLQKTHKEGED